MAVHNPFTDHAVPVLAGDPTLTDEQRADLHDAFYSKNPAELTEHLQAQPIPDDTKHKLLQAKMQTIPPAVEPLNKATEAIKQMANIDQATLDLAESHPNVLKALSAAALTEKAPQEPAAARSAAPKGNTPEPDDKPAPLAQPPRTDGLQHLPPIPDGHRRILASDGGLHDIPEENVEKARAVDPNLHVLNP